MPSPEPLCWSCSNSGRLFFKGRRAGDPDTSILCGCKHGRRVMREEYPRKKAQPDQCVEVDAGEVAGETTPGPNYTPDPDLD